MIMNFLIRFSFSLVFLFSINVIANGQAPAAAPPGGGGTPPADPPNPTASTNPCGAKTLTRSGTPPTGTVWYWQTSANGVVVDNSQQTYPAPASGTYYIRAHTPATGLWSLGSGFISVTVTNPAAPPMPSIQHNCYEAIFTRGTPPLGTAWYWQGTNPAGTSTNSSETYTATTSGTYYIRSYTSNCWGPSTAIAFSQTQAPSNPPAPLSSGGCGSVTLSFNGSPEHLIRWAWQTSSSGKDLSNTNASKNVTSSGKYYLRAFDTTTGCWSPVSSEIDVVVRQVPATPPTPNVVNGCGQSTLSYPSNSVPLGVTWYWQQSPDGTGTNNNTPNYVVTTSRQYFLRAKTDAGCWSSNSSLVDVSVIQLMNPYITPSGSITIGSWETQTITASTTSGTEYSFQWYRNDVAIPGSIGAAGTYSTSTDGIYKVEAIGPGNCREMSSTLTIMHPPNNYNYIKTTNIQKKGVFDGQVANLVTGEKIESIQYFDGLGRLVQSVAVEGSPLQKDVVQPVVYDQFGREAVKYLPYASMESNGFYKTEFIDKENPSYLIQSLSPQFRFYQNGSNITRDLNPYAVTVFESCPLNRVVKQGAAGVAWQPDIVNSYSSTDHTIKKAYEFNIANEVMIFEYVYPTPTYPMGSIQLGSPGYYKENTLFKNKTKDENQNEVIEFTDSEGRTILKKVQVTSTTYAETYYIYDDFGNLVNVLSPEATKGFLN
jgi:hypothetical protein